MSLGQLLTPRLLLRRTRFSDISWLQELLIDGEIRKKTLQPPRQGVAAWLHAYGEVRDTRLVMEEVGSGTPVGWILLCRLEPAPHAAIGFEVRRSFWNRGYATEATRAVIEHVFTKTEEPALSGLVFVNNPASQRVFEKAGFQTIGRCECEGHPCIQYEIGAQQWRSGRSI